MNDLTPLDHVKDIKLKSTSVTCSEKIIDSNPIVQSAPNTWHSPPIRCGQGQPMVIPAPAPAAVAPVAGTSGVVACRKWLEGLDRLCKCLVWKKDKKELQCFSHENGSASNRFLFL